jgi:hypothetical protein
MAVLASSNMSNAPAFRSDGDAHYRAYAGARLLGAISSIMLPLLKDL